MYKGIDTVVGDVNDIEDCARSIFPAVDYVRPYGSGITIAIEVGGVAYRSP